MMRTLTFAPQAAKSGVDVRGYRDRFIQLPACLNVLDFKDLVRAINVLIVNQAEAFSKVNTANG